jgi:hypothetical protein
VVDKLLDPRNWGVVSVVVGGATRQTLETIIDVWRESAAATRGNGEDRDGDFRDESNGDARGGALESALASALRVAASDDGRSVLLDVCSTFVSQMVGTYLDKTAGSNTFDDFFAAALAASNREAFGDIAGRVTGEAVRTVVEAVSPAAAATADARSSAPREGPRTRRRGIPTGTDGTGTGTGTAFLGPEPAGPPETCSRIRRATSSRATRIRPLRRRRRRRIRRNRDPRAFSKRPRVGVRFAARALPIPRRRRRRCSRRRS